ncbi:MAG: MinD/ParA family protein [Bdellovibrionota bacterium]
MDQADRLRTLAGFSDSNRSARIISITSGKGGVGKSNIAANMATLYAAKGLKVLLIDADMGLANANLLMGCRVEKTLDDVMFGDARLQETFVKTPGGFDLLPSSSGVRKMLELDAFAQRTLMDRLQEIIHEYDIVIYDTAPGIGSMVLNFNASAHDIVVVAHPEPTALADAYALIKVMALERKEKKFRLLINRAHSLQDGLDAFKRLTDVSAEFLNISVDFLGSLPEDPCVLKAVRQQRPTVHVSPKCPFAIALGRVADKLLACSHGPKDQNRTLSTVSLRGAS